MVQSSRCARKQQADSIIVSFFSADSPTGMFKQLPTDVPAQQALSSSVDRQLPAEAQQACEGPDEGIPLAELHSALKASARGKKPGSDGLPYEFYTQFWDLLGPALLAGRCPFPSGKQPSRTPDEPEMCTNNDPDCTRRSAHREKSPERGWQSILGPRRPANVAGHVVEHGESTHKQRRTIACMQEDMQAVSGNAA
ncbi:hypothetical protein ABBQ32_012581 [Trebouxia sp. C0010 RCD-2024]